MSLDYSKYIIKPKDEINTTNSEEYLQAYYGIDTVFENKHLFISKKQLKL